MAVISEIIAAPDPEASARHLHSILRSFLDAGPSRFLTPTTQPTSTLTAQEITQRAFNLIASLPSNPALIHHLTNDVVQTQSANATLALGGSPLMSLAFEEMEDLAQIPGGMLINIGTITAEKKRAMLEAGKWANVHGKPVVFDPVGVGASGFRKQSTLGMYAHSLP